MATSSGPIPEPLYTLSPPLQEEDRLPRAETPSNSTRSPLVRLPAELRRMIWEYVITNSVDDNEQYVCDHPIEWHPPGFVNFEKCCNEPAPIPSALLICRQITTEINQLLSTPGKLPLTLVFGSSTCFFPDFPLIFEALRGRVQNFKIAVVGERYNWYSRLTWQDQHVGQIVWDFYYYFWKRFGFYAPWMEKSPKGPATRYFVSRSNKGVHAKFDPWQFLDEHDFEAFRQVLRYEELLQRFQRRGEAYSRQPNMITLDSILRRRTTGAVGI